jgi:hypothetical protein
MLKMNPVFETSYLALFLNVVFEPYFPALAFQSQIFGTRFEPPYIMGVVQASPQKAGTF